MQIKRFLFCLIIGLTPAAWAGANHPAQKYIEGDVLITFKPAASALAVQQSMAAHSLVFRKLFPELSRHQGKQTGLVHVKNRTTMELIQELSQDPAVETAEPNYLRWVTTQPPNDALFTNLWALQNTGQTVNSTAGKSASDIRFVGAWGLARPSSNVVIVAVIDTGVDYTHPDLAGNMWVICLWQLLQWRNATNIASIYIYQHDEHSNIYSGTTK